MTLPLHPTSMGRSGTLHAIYVEEHGDSFAFPILCILPRFHLHFAVHMWPLAEATASYKITQSCVTSLWNAVVLSCLCIVNTMRRQSYSSYDWYVCFVVHQLYTTPALNVKSTCTAPLPDSQWYSDSPAHQGCCFASQLEKPALYKTKQCKTLEKLYNAET